MGKYNIYKQGKNETKEQYNERMRVYEILNNSGATCDTRHIDEYIDILNKNKVEYLEVDFEKKSGRHCRMVIPLCNTSIMSQRAFAKIFKKP